MEYVHLGNTGLEVSRICMGCMTFGRECDEQQSRAIIHAALDAGVNFFDTANVYSNGESERITGAALRGHRDRIVLATKVRGRMGQGPNSQGLSRYHILRECENSLQRLGTDHIDLYQTHIYDAATPIEETLSALTDLVRQGKVRYIGCSNISAWRLTEALWVSDRRNLERYVSLQPRYSILSREAELELLPLCAAHGLGVIVYSPLCGGILTGKYKPGEPPPPGSRPDTNRNFGQFYTDENLRKVQQIGELATSCDMTPAQFAIAWVLANSAVTSAIVGARTVEQLQQSLPGAEATLGEDELAAVAQIVGPIWVPPNTAMWRPQ